MRILVTGARGMLGVDMVDRLSPEHTVLAADRAELDITDPEQVAATVRDLDAVVNCAAWTAVDDAQEAEAEAFTLNAVGPALLARAASETGARMVQISTDYVFDGAASAPYAETAPVRPTSAYGRTKAAGEWAVRAAGSQHLIVRTAWLYGASGGCFPKTITRLARERGGLDVVADQSGQPTWTVDVADLVARLLNGEVAGGIYHATSTGQTTWWEFAQAACASAGLDPASITPTTSENFVRPAPRPAYSVLGHQALLAQGIRPISGWRERWERAAESVLG